MVVATPATAVLLVLAMAPYLGVPEVRDILGERGTLEGAEYQLWLQNRFTLRDVDNLAIAPGYAELK